MSEIFDNEIINNMMHSIEHVRAAEATYRLYPQMVETVVENGFESLVKKLKKEFPEPEYHVKIREDFYSCTDADALAICNKNHPQLKAALYFGKPNCQFAEVGVIFSKEGKNTLRKHSRKIEQALGNELGKSYSPSEWWPWSKPLSEHFHRWDNLELLQLFMKDDHELLIEEFKEIVRAMEGCFKELPDIFSS